MPQAISPVVAAAPGNANHVGSTSVKAAKPAPTTDLEVRRPKLDHIPYETFALSTLIGRVIQDSYGRLGGLVDELQKPGQSDGAKKKLLMDTAQHIRKQFIKVLVITMWSKDAGKVSEVIDLRLWLAGRQNVFNNVVIALRNIRMAMGQARYAAGVSSGCRV